MLQGFYFWVPWLKNVISLPVCLPLKPTQQAAQVQDVLVCCNWQICCTSPALPTACQTGICIKIVELREHKEYLGWLSASWMQEVSRNVFVTASCSYKWTRISDLLSGVEYFQHWLEGFSSQLSVILNGSHMAEVPSPGPENASWHCYLEEVWEVTWFHWSSMGSHWSQWGPGTL